MKKFYNHKRFVAIVVILIVLLPLIINGIYQYTKSKDSEVKKSALKEPVLSYMKKVEALDVAPIENKIFENNRESLIFADSISEDRLFKTLNDLGTIIIGDSRALGFSTNNFLDNSHVFADIGWSIYSIPTILPLIENTNPRNIVVSFGLNELPYNLDESEFESNTASFIADLEYNLDLIHLQFPDSNIYLSSILPVTADVIASRPGYAIIPSRNEALKKMCSEKGYSFIDMTSYAQANQDLYALDGMHFAPEFYPIWGKAILNAITSREGGGSVDSMDDAQVWTMLEQFGLVISGDSRGAEFSAFGFYPQYLNFSGYSKTIYNIPEIYDRVASAKPRFLLLCYGVNDLGLYGNLGVEKYMSDLHGFVNTLRELSPNTTVIVCSIPPSLPSEYQRSPAWALAYPWNEYNEAYCKENGIRYLNITELCDAHQDMYRGDGVHFQPVFYPYWGRAILKELLKHEN